MKTDSLKELVSGLDLQTDLWWLAMMLAGFLTTFLAAFGFPNSGTFFIYLGVFLRLAIAAGVSQQPYGTVFARLLPFALTSGLCSIFGDHMLVNWTERGQRIYPEHTGVLLSSPLYMPLLWACLLLDFGYALVRIYGMLGARSNGDVGLYITMVAGGLLAAVWSACTDFWAVKAGWWAYRPGKVILGDSCALYVVIGTFFIFCAFLPILARYLSCGGSRLYAAIRYGFIFGGVIFISYIMAHLLVENRI